MIAADLPAGTAQNVNIRVGASSYSEWRCAIAYPLVIAPGANDPDHCQNRLGSSNTMAVGDICVTHWSPIVSPGTSVTLDPLFRFYTDM